MRKARGLLSPGVRCHALYPGNARLSLSGRDGGPDTLACTLAASLLAFAVGCPASGVGPVSDAETEPSFRAEPAPSDPHLTESRRSVEPRSAPRTKRNRRGVDPTDETPSGIYFRIRTLFAKVALSDAELHQLRQEVENVCKSSDARLEFFEGIRWSTSFATAKDETTIKLATEAVEEVANRCFREHPEGALELLERASEVVPKMVRFDLLRGRLLAAAGRLDEAIQAGEAAERGGSIHAVALLASLHAERARQRVLRYEPGMFDQALSLVDREPTMGWLLIDLTAVLSTRARLLTERALWEDGAESRKTLAAARSDFSRLSVAPFIEATRTRAQDVNCFYSRVLSTPNDGACRRAAAETRNLGAALLAEVELDGRYDRERYARLRGAKESLGRLGPDHSVLIIARGDESEILEWGFAASQLIRRIGAKGSAVVWVDRVDGQRVSRVMERVLDLAKVTPRLRIPARGEPLATACVAALVAQREAPRACPLPLPTRRVLESLPPVAFAVLIGRDLDSDVDDLLLYDLEPWLLSFRLHRVPKAKGRIVEFKSLSDVHVVAP